MTSALKSEAAFKERANECGLSTDQIKSLTDRGMSSLSAVAYSLGTPGETVGEDQLRRLLDPDSPDAVTVGGLASIRQLVFESQTMVIQNLKLSLETPDSGRHVELVASERTARIRSQATRLRGMNLSGQLECSFCSYDYVAQVLEKDHIMYLEPARFTTRQSEVLKDRPTGRELVLDEGSRIGVRDKTLKDRCLLTTELDLARALSRRALACDLMQLCTFDCMERWHTFLLDRMKEPPPPGFRPISMEQVLRCDRAGFLRLAQLLPSVKVKADGSYPMDAALDTLRGDPTVMFNLLPLQGSSPLKAHADSSEIPQPAKVKPGPLINRTLRSVNMKVQPRALPCLPTLLPWLVSVPKPRPVPSSAGTLIPRPRAASLLKQAESVSVAYTFACVASNPTLCMRAVREAPDGQQAPLQGTCLHIRRSPLAVVRRPLTWGQSPGCLQPI